MSEALNIDLDELKVSEIEMIEEITGMPIDECFLKGVPKGKVMRALGVVMKRREDPNFSIEDAGDLVIRITEPEPNPTTAAS